MLAGFSLLFFVQAIDAETPDRKMRVSDTGSVREATRLAQIEKIVVAKLEFYSAQFPDMNFVVLDAAGDVGKNMHALSKIIGEDPIPLDYAHPKKLRQDLLMVTLMRIEVLLSSDIGSATLFKPGTGATARRKKVCVITINPWAIAADDRAATDHLLELPPQDFNAIPPKTYLDHVSHLKFALDHEIYHCLDAAYNGPIPMSHRKYWGGYYNYKNESGADAFGILMNIAEHGTITSYARMLKNIRGLTLLNGDTDHYTYRSIGATLRLDPAAVSKKNVQELFHLATQLRNRIAGGYDDYVRYAIAANQAMKQLGEQPEVEQADDVKPDNTMVKTLIDATKDAYKSLTGQSVYEQKKSR